MTSIRKNYALGDIIDLIGGGTPKTSVEEYWGGSIPWLSVKDFNDDNRYVYLTEKTITEKGLEDSSTKLLEKDDIIISARGTVGELAMLPFPMAFNQSCYGIRGKIGLVEQSYLYYLIKDSIQLLKRQTHGSVFETITRDTFTNIEVSLPTLDEQRRISPVLIALDNQIETNGKINHHLEQMAQAIFKSWFVDFEPFDGTMPDDWREGTIGDTCSAIYNGGTPRRNEPLYWGGVIPWLTSGEVRQAIITKPDNCISEAGLKGSSAKWVPPLSTVVALYGATAGQVSMVAAPLTTNQAISALVPKDNHAFYNYLVMRNAVAQLENKAIGSAQQNISKAIVEETSCLIVDQNVIIEFDKLVSPLFNEWRQNLFESAQLAELRDTLLPRLMSGELSVADL